MVSAAPVQVIEFPIETHSLHPALAGDDDAGAVPQTLAELGWLSQPLSGRSLVWTINILVMVAALLLFALVFLTVTGEPPRWPFSMMGGAAILVVAMYWGFFQLFGGSSPGERLARLVGCDQDEDAEDGPRFR